MQELASSLGAGEGMVIESEKISQGSFVSQKEL